MTYFSVYFQGVSSFLRGRTIPLLINADETFPIKPAVALKDLERIDIRVGTIERVGTSTTVRT